MKKKTRSNLIMVVLIVVIMITGILAAYFLMGDGQNAPLGTDFEGSQLTDETGKFTCTVTILCDTVLAHSDQLNQAKAPYVPDDGVVLAKTKQNTEKRHEQIKDPAELQKSAGKTG